MRRDSHAGIADDNSRRTNCSDQQRLPYPCVPTPRSSINFINETMLNQLGKIGCQNPRRTAQHFAYVQNTMPTIAISDYIHSSPHCLTGPYCTKRAVETASTHLRLA